MNGRLTISEVAERVGVTTRTIKRWEDTGKVGKAKRDWRGWRVYDHEDIEELIEFHDTVIKCE
ncbi:MAG: MerR family transcriptional regulator [Candidatus Scalinduaceae bacterium]